MPDADSPAPAPAPAPAPDPEEPPPDEAPTDGVEEKAPSNSDESYEYDSEYDSEDVTFVDNLWSDGEDDYSTETTVRKFNEAFDSKEYQKREEKEMRELVYDEDLFDFPKDPENWREEDLQELWADGPVDMTKIGWDPVWADEEDWDIVRDEIKAGKDPPIAPFYVPFRRPYPAIPDNHYDIQTAKAVVEELDRIEEFLTWVSFIFPNGSSLVHFDLFEYLTAYFELFDAGYDWIVVFVFFFFKV